MFPDNTISSTYPYPPNYCDPYPSPWINPYQPFTPIDPFTPPSPYITPIPFYISVPAKSLKDIEDKMRILCIAYEALLKSPIDNEASIKQLKESIDQLCREALQA